MKKTRQAFSHSSLISKIHGSFKQSTQGIDKVSNKFKEIQLSDCLMSGVAIFALKYKSLLKFEEEKATETLVKHNLRSLYGIHKVPCDTYLRERLDGLDLSIIRGAFNKLFAPLQRGKVLEQWKFLDDKFLISLDASGFFSSNNIKCDQCCSKVHNKGGTSETISYHHQMLVGSVVSPLMKQVLPIGFEPIIKEDGNKKNDCERNCAKRWLELFRKSHPQLPTIIVADGLYSNAPFIKALQDKRCSYILVAKKDDHKSLYEYFWYAETEDICDYSYSSGTENNQYHHRYRFMNEVPLNDTNYKQKVNVLYYEEHDVKKDKKTRWLWVTDIKITKENARFIMQAGRARWKIENETFNTLKNQGYNFEHNYGHGYKGLSNVFAGLMLLAFFVDQCLEAVNLEFQGLLKKYRSRSNLFDKIRARFFIFRITSYDRLYEAMILAPPQDRWL